jgi:hypothetical protein
LKLKGCIARQLLSKEDAFWKTTGLVQLIKVYKKKGELTTKAKSAALAVDFKEEHLRE